MELLTQPRDEGCRRVALAYLADAESARGRLGQDAEALHDLRVALRRFRSTLRAWRAVMDKPLRGRARKELGRIVDATSDARDAEVLLELLQKEGAQPGTLLEALQARKRDGYLLVEERLAELPRLAERLRRRLSRVRIDLLHPHKLAHALADLVDDHADDLEDDLKVLRTATQVQEAHRARISVKRLRYLIEPYKEDEHVARLVKACKALQDVLGELHDTHLASAEVVAAVGTALDDERAPLLELAARLELRQLQLFAALEGEWLGDPRLVAQARTLAAELRGR
jgi:CHAD domain-containing protein